MGRHEEPVEPGPLFEFATDLRALRRAAGSPPYRRLERTARFSASTLADAASGKRLPTRDVTLAYVGACGGDVAAWHERWTVLAAEVCADSGAPPAAVAAAADGDPADGSASDLVPTAGPLVEPVGRSDPRRVGPYRVLGRLGTGAMGDVFLASSPAGRPVAVKLIRTELARDAVFRRRFAREVAAARTVAGGHTPAVVDADPNAERPWMATAYLPGPSLGQVLETGGPLPEPVVLALAGGIAEALEAVHAAGIVHRDLKPSNILLADDGPKVIDFGISRALDGTTLTATGATVGTAGYTAPELAARGEASPASDVFSLGVVLAYAATGIAAFGEGRSSDVLYRVVHEPPASEALACQDNNLRKLIEGCLDKDPAARPTPRQIVAACDGAGTGPGSLPAALAAQIAQRGRDAAALLAQARRAHTIRRVRIGLAPLLLILAIATVAALTVRSSPTHLDTAPPITTATATPSSGITTPVTPSVSVSSGASVSASSSSALGGGLPSASQSPSANHAVVVGQVTLRQLNNPDFNGYCQATGQGTVKLIADNAYGWKCSADNGTGDDAQAVCEWSNGGTTQVTNRVADFSDPNSWQCWAASRELGAINWNTYCQDKGFAGVSDAGQNNVYTWHCTGSGAGLDAQDACRVLYGSTPPISRFQDYYDKNSWQCWG